MVGGKVGRSWDSEDIEAREVEVPSRLGLEFVRESGGLAWLGRRSCAEWEGGTGNMK